MKIQPLWYLGGYDMEEKAARAYDCAALKYWGPSTHINFPVRYDSVGLFLIFFGFFCLICQVDPRTIDYNHMVLMCASVCMHAFSIIWIEDLF